MSQGGQSLSTVEGLDAASKRGLMTASVSEKSYCFDFLNMHKLKQELKLEMKNAVQKLKDMLEQP